MRTAAPALLLLTALAPAWGCVASLRPPDAERDPLCTDRPGVGGIGCPPPSTDTEPLTGTIGRPEPDIGQGSAATSDLYTLRERQGEFKRRHGAYARFADDAELDFEASAGVRIQILKATADGWSAVATVRSTGRECAIYEGAAARPRAYVFEPGVVACAR